MWIEQACIYMYDTLYGFGNEIMDVYILDSNMYEYTNINSCFDYEYVIIYVYDRLKNIYKCIRLNH